MSNILNNTSSLQAVLEALQNKAVGGEQATPVISVSSNGLITATAGTKSSTHQLAFQAATTYTPSITNQTISAGTYLTGVQTIKGDSNLVAGNIKSGVSIFGVSGTFEAGNMEDDFVTAVISNYTNSRVSSIGQGAFALAPDLRSINFPNVKTIGVGAFYRCSKLTTANFPACTTISADAFHSCSNLTTISFPNVIFIEANQTGITGTFYHCSKLTTASFPACTTIGSHAFEGCSSLTTVSFPVATTIGGYAFCYCSKPTTVSFPACTTIGDHAFYKCSNLTTASFPVCTTIDTNAFRDCFNIETLSFPACTTIYSYAFQRCKGLQALYLTGSNLCTLSHSNAFNSTPYAGYSASFSGTPYIYVPASLVNSYKTATNWTYFSKYFSAIEGSGGDAGGGGGAENPGVPV